MADSGHDTSVTSEGLYCVNCGEEGHAQKLFGCERCLEVLLNPSTGHVTCLTCSTLTQEGDSQLRPEFLRKYLFIERHAATMLTPKSCDTCESSDKSTKAMGMYICLGCDGAQLCHECTTVHRNQSGTGSHRTIPLSEMRLSQVMETVTSFEPLPICAKHHRDTHPQPLKFYCQSCQKSVCATCWFKEHQTVEHKVITLSEQARQKCELLKEKASTLQEQIMVCEHIYPESTKTLKRNDVNTEESIEEVDGGSATFGQDINDTLQAEKAYKNLDVKPEKQKLDICAQTRASKADQGYAQSAGPFVPCIESVFEQDDNRTSAMHEQSTSECVTQKHPTKSISQFEAKEHILRLLVLSGISTEYKPVGVFSISRLWSVTVAPLLYIRDLDFNSAGDVLLVGCSSNRENSIHIYGHGYRKLLLDSQLQTPYSICVQAEDIYVSNLSDTIVRMASTGEVKYIHWVPGSRGRCGVGVTVGTDGTIYATHSNNNKLWALGTRSPRELDLASEHLRKPLYLCLSPLGQIVVSNKGTHSVCLFDNRGRLKGHHGGEGKGQGQLLYPRGVCCDKTGLIYVADLCNDRISLFTPSGEFVDHVINSKHGIERPRCVAFNAQGTLLAVGHSDNELTVFKIQVRHGTNVD